MKKSLLALAVLAASGAAFAQSSVTLYGVADLGISKANNGGKVQMTGNGFANNGNSRFGLRGVEDLGGGLNAFFNVEAGVNAENGNTDIAATTVKLATGETVVTGASATTFQRAAYAGLRGGFGEIRLGRGLTLGWAAMANYELTGTANYSAPANAFGFTGGTRQNSEIRYTSPKFGGASVGLGYVLAADTANNKAKLDLAAMYNAGPVAASVAYSKASGGERSYMLGGSYNLGVAKIAAGYYDPAGAAKGFSVGAGANFGAASVVLDVVRRTDTKKTGFLVEGKYNLSKRTNVYATYSAKIADMNTTANTNVFGLGLRHNF